MNKRRQFEPEPAVLREPEPLTWAATPLQVYGRPDVGKQQAEVYKAIEQRTIESMPDDLPQELKEFVFASVVQRFHDENMRNYTSYEARLVRDLDGLSLEDLGAYERAKAGHASPESLLDIRQKIGLPSIELGKVSHPNGSHIEDLAPMRQGIAQAIISRGGVVHPDDNGFNKLKIRSGEILTARSEDHQPLGVAMTRKRWIGSLNDDTRIFERSNFVVRLDKDSALPREVRSAIRKIKVINNPTWREEYFAVEGFIEAVYDVLNGNMYAAAIPLSTTAFAFNLTTQREIERRQEEARANHLTAPDVMRLRKLLAETSFDTSRIAYFGPEQTEDD